MSKIIRVYDGTVYKDIECEEILTPPPDNKPTGHYKKESETIVTKYGTYLDIEANYLKLKSDIENLQKEGYYTNYICLFTDYGEHLYMLSNFVGGGFTPQVYKSWFTWAFEIIQQLGYMNVKHEVITEPFKSIIITLTPKDGESPNFKMHLIPMDARCDKYQN